MSPLADPYLELYSSAGTLLGKNDSWQINLDPSGSQKTAIINTGIPPTNNYESAILAVLNPGAYTAILSGTSNGTGVGLVEIYDIGAFLGSDGQGADLANISTRGMVQTGSNVMIGGFINTGTNPIKIIARAIGPSLAHANPPVAGALADPILKLLRSDGTTILTNDNWKKTQMAEIQETTLQPTNDSESAVVYTLPAVTPPKLDSYTVVVSGVGNTSGVALVEVYFGNPCLATSMSLRGAK